MAIENLDDFIPMIDLDVSLEEDVDDKKAPENDSTSEEEEEDDDLPSGEPFELDEDEEEDEADEEDEEGLQLPVANESAAAKATALVLKEIGLINPEKDVESYDDLEDVLKVQAPQAVANALISELPEYGKNLALFILNKGEDLTKQDLKDFYNSFFEDELVENMSFDEDNIEEAKSFLRQEFKAKGLKNATIEKTLDALDLEGEILDEANSILEEKKKQSKTAEKVAKSSEESNSKKIDEVNFVKSIRTEISQTNWREDRQKKVLSMIANNQIKDVISDAFQNPKTLVAFANLLSYYDFDKKEFDLTDFFQKEATKEVEKVKKSIFKDAMRSAGSGGASDKDIDRTTRSILPSGLKPIL